jgi:hypothetical protein
MSLLAAHPHAYSSDLANTRDNKLTVAYRNRLHPKHYAEWAFHLTNRYALPLLETWIAPNPTLPIRYPPIFFLGAPRSGSTLAVQVLTEVLDIGYISNRHCQWFGAGGKAFASDTESAPFRLTLATWRNG